ncbi:hypothetical protein [Kineococcus esterisolvens]|uniref:hypothetical protein n=1 Tax=unclassified Kineococcus TaxID=2621656 RepID=UPI003D7D9468
MIDVPAGGRGAGARPGREFLALLEVLRAHWPGQKLHVVLDDSSPHKHAEVRA